MGSNEHHLQGGLSVLMGAGFAFAIAQALPHCMGEKREIQRRPGRCFTFISYHMAQRVVHPGQSLLAFLQPLLNELRNALIVRCDPGHDGVSFDHLHVVGNVRTSSARNRQNSGSSTSFVAISNLYRLAQHRSPLR